MHAYITSQSKHQTFLSLAKLRQQSVIIGRVESSAEIRATSATEIKQ